MNIEKLFIESKGKPIVVKGKTLVRLDRFKMPFNKMSLKLSFIETNSEWKQGFILKTKGVFDIEGLQIVNNSIIFWEDTAPKNIKITVDSKDGNLLVYNVWDFGDGVTQAWHNGAAIEVKHDSEKQRIYYCNDGHPNLSLNDLIFSMSW